MRFTTHTLTIAMAGGFAALLAACGGSGEPASAPAPSAAPAVTETPVVEAPAAETPAAAEVAPVEAAADAPAAGATGFAAYAGDAVKGKRVFAQCMTCHVVQEGRNNVGPSLYGIVGRTAGTIEGFKYSAANQNSGIVWNEEIMFDYLENPAAYIPGTIMAFPGLKNPQDRADVIAYLKSVPTGG